MFAFRFRITFEDNDSFMRDVELASSQTFEDFHNSIINDLKLDNNKGASFFLCDHRFRKQQEISLSEEHKQTTNEDDISDEPAGEDSLKQNRKLVMKEHKLSELIDDPHQRLIYIFDVENNWTFYLELLKITPVNSSSDYPKIIKQAGGIPPELIPKNIKLSDVEPDDEPGSEGQMNEPGSEEDSFPEIMENLDDTFGIEEENSREDDALDENEPDDDKY